MKVNKNLPIPPASKGGAPAKYPWKTMDIGDSFVATSKSIVGQASAMSKPNGRRFITRRVDDGWRVWRVA